MTKKVAFYARAARKTGEGSVIEQIERGKAFAANRGWALAGCFTDAENNDALFKARPGIRSLCAYMDRETIDIVLCDTPANLSNNRTHVTRFLNELGRREIELWSTAMTERVTPHNLPHIDLGIDQAKATSTHFPESDQGVRPAGYGYKLSSGIDAAGRRIVGYRVVHPEQAEVIRHIFRLYAAGRSAREIASMLNAEGIEGPDGRPWCEEAIAGNRARGTGILDNTLYVGMRQNADGEFDGYVPALRIVGDELWHRVRQQQANVRRRFSPSW